MVVKSGGGAATNSGIDFQQRVASLFVLSMGLELDVANLFEKTECLKINSVSFETNDCIDDIVLYHDSYKSYLQVKRKLSLSDQTNSDFYKTIEQFVLEYKQSLNANDCYVMVTSTDTSKKILSELKNITDSSRLNDKGLELNPMSKSEKDTYNKFLSCVNCITKRNALNSLSNEEVKLLLKRMYIISLDLESGGAYESAFLTSIACSLTTNPKLIWSLIISKSLDWSKKRQSVDLNGIKKLLSEFVKKDISSDKDEENLKSIKFDAENYDICSGREVIIIDSFLPEAEILILELFRFDSNDNKRFRFSETHVEMAYGSKHKLYGRFATFSGAERYISKQEWMKDKKSIILPINGENNYDSSPFSIAYSEKVRTKILSNKYTSSCVHCGNGISSEALIVEVDENDLPFDAGMIHYKCCRASDRVLGQVNIPGNETYSELIDFDYNKWLKCIKGSQVAWNKEKSNLPVKYVIWNSEYIKERKGKYCIKIMLSDETFSYVLERSKVQRFTYSTAKKQIDQMKEKLQEYKDKGNPFCLSADGEIFGRYNDIQKSSPTPLDLVECIDFNLITYTRGISLRFDKTNNYYAPLIYFRKKKNYKEISFNGYLFLLTNPMEVKIYLKNWKTIELILDDYIVDIIENDDAFDDLMLSCQKKGISVLVDPFFKKNRELMKGFIIQSKKELFRRNGLTSILYIINNDDDETFTHLYRDAKNDLTLLLNNKCTNINCNCFGCQMYKMEMRFSDGQNVNENRISDNTVAIEVNSESQWTPEFISKNSVDWNEWAKIIGILKT